MLTRGQEEVFNGVVKAIERGEKRIIIKGSAGVGKTYLSESLIKYFANKIPRWGEERIYVTAPTNKALSILQQKVGLHRSITFKTTHAALKLKKKYNSNSSIISFEPQWGREKPFHQCILAFVDECSMLNTALIKYLDEYSFPIIFIGDDKQINPVGELNIPIFERNYPVFELTEIIRQGEGNPIIDLSRDLDLMWFREPNVIDGKGYVFNNDRHQIIENLAEVNGSDELKYIAWTNPDIDSVNKQVRERVYTEPKRIELGESIIFKEPYEEYWNNQEVKIKELEIREVEFKVPDVKTKFTKEGDWVNPTFQKFKVYRGNENIFVLHEDSDFQFGQMKAYLKSKCNSEGWDWRGFYFFVEQFANITYNHAVTVHKSQGSTFKEAVVNAGNINFNPVIVERQRLFYTAVTRASDLLILANVR